MKKVILCLGISISSLSSFGQVSGYWELAGSSTYTVLRNVLTHNGATIKELDLQTNLNTRARIFEDGRWQINARTGAGGFNTDPQGHGSLATFKIRGGGSSGLVSSSMQTSDWGQNIQSYVGRAYTVSHVVNWNGNDRFFVTGQGWLFGNGAWFNSDRKLKDEIVPLRNSLDRVLKLNGYNYKFKAETLCAGCDSATSPVTDRKLEMGFMADEVEAIVPEVVRTVGEDNKKAIAYQNIVALLVEATKEQQKMINNLQAQVAKMMAFGGFNGQGSTGGNGNNGGIITESTLFTNSPNAFNNATTISYFLKDGVIKAEMKIWDMQGIERKVFLLDSVQGNSNVVLYANDLPVSGSYVYALIVDGQIMGSKTMVCNK